MPKDEEFSEEGLRITRTVKITEERGEIMQLPGMLAMVPVLVGLVTYGGSDNFLIGMLAAFVVFAILRWWLHKRPDHFVWMVLWDVAAPKKWRPKLDATEVRRW